MVLVWFIRNVSSAVKVLKPEIRSLSFVHEHVMEKVGLIVVLGESLGMSF